MAENDIYNSKGKYERYKANLAEFLLPPEKRKKRGSWHSRYHCKNPDNLKHFKRLFAILDAKDLSYIRRNRIVETLRFITHATEKDLAACEREDIDRIVSSMHTAYKSPISKQDFIKTMKYIWRLLFPEKDDKGRADETVTPYLVRHLSASLDKSRQKAREDKLTWQEYENIINYFSSDPMMQCYITMHFECLARPQELCYIRLSNCEVYDDYALVHITEHGKEGPKKLLVIDAFPYFVEWFNQHPLKSSNAFLFINERGRQLNPWAANKKIKIARKRLGIKKPITNYSLKRSGVTLRRQRGDSDTTIQHIAGWTSTKQLKTYDLTVQDDVFKIELAKRGIIKDTQYKKYAPKTKKCLFCETDNGFAQEMCSTCKRPLDREKIRQSLGEKETQAVDQFLDHPEMQWLFKTVRKLDKLFDSGGS